jgi:hypothetical protein
MKREDLSVNLKKMKTKVAELKAKRQPSYVTCGKYINGVGYVKDLETLRECAKALKVINNHFDSEVSGIDEIGIEANEIKNDQNFLGFQREEWIADLKNRVAVLRDSMLLANLEKSISKLSKHRSSDDIFAEDTDGMDDLLKSCE